MDNEMKMMFNTIIDEMGRMEDRINKRFEKIENQLEIMHYEINACKLERESIGLQIKKIDQLESRIEESEKRTA